MYRPNELEIDRNIRLNLHEPVYDSYRRAWYIEHFDDGRWVKTQFKSEGSAHLHYIYLYNLFRKNYISIVMQNQRRR